MADVFSRSKRSEIMQRIRSKNTRPEKAVRSQLHKHGLRFRIHSRHLFGSPDVVLKKYNTVVFVNGCFWHRHNGCRYSSMPKTRRDFWRRKILRTVRRDREQAKKLRRAGWNVVVIWECGIRGGNAEKSCKKLAYKIQSLKTKRGKFAEVWNAK